MKAVNKAGESKPADVTTPVKTTRKQRKPKIDARHWNDIVKKIGQGFELECTYTGVPEPTIEWLRIDDVSLSDHSDVRQVCFDDGIKLSTQYSGPTTY